MVFNIRTEHNKEQHVCMNTCRSTEGTKLPSSFYVKHPQRQKKIQLKGNDYQI